jgi:hypothetical protein
MTRLALVAVLLLALAPAVSRVLASGTPQVLAGWSELCTSMGLKPVASGARSVPGHVAMPDGGDYCDYCPLAASLPLLALFLAFLLPWPPRAGRVAAAAAPRLRLPANFRGLGGQGPPLAI